jgi:hypothetical protein
MGLRTSKLKPSVDSVTAETAATVIGAASVISRGAPLVVVTSDNADKVIHLPKGRIGDIIRILVGTTGCELRCLTAADKINDVTSGATNEAALTAENLYTCEYVAANKWVVVGWTKLGAIQAALVPDAR